MLKTVHLETTKAVELVPQLFYVLAYLIFDINLRTLTLTITTKLL